MFTLLFWASSMLACKPHRAASVAIEGYSLAIIVYWKPSISTVSSENPLYLFILTFIIYTAHFILSIAMCISNDSLSSSPLQPQRGIIFTFTGLKRKRCNIWGETKWKRFIWARNHSGLWRSSKLPGYSFQLQTWQIYLNSLLTTEELKEQHERELKVK